MTRSDAERHAELRDRAAFLREVAVGLMFLSRCRREEARLLLSRTTALDGRDGSPVGPGPEAVRP